MASSASSPHLTGGAYSPLEELARKALRRVGDFAPEAAEGDVWLMMIELANLVLDEIRTHPYWTGGEPDYYEAISDVRPVSDTIMVAGLIAHYCLQQNSPKAATYRPLFYQTMNRELWRLGAGNSKVQVRPVDGGTRLDRSPPANAFTGKPLV